MYNKIMARLISKFVIRWSVCSLGLWVAAGLLGHHISYGGSLGTIIIAGLILAVINTIIRPIIILLSLPAVILTLGLFMIIINGLTVYLASVLYPPLQITNFWAAVFAGIIIGLVNFAVTAILEG